MRSILSVRRAAVLGGSALAATTLGVGLAGPALASSSNDFAALRQCESSGDYSINTGNGYYGAYQFALATWRWLGYTGLPSQASPAVQDEAAQRLQAIAGWGPWPACSHSLGLTGGPAEQGPPLRATTSTTASSATASTARPTSAVAPSSSGSAYASYDAPPAAQPVLSTALHGQWSRAVATWQAQMAHRGWTIAVDGLYGPQSASVAHQFEVAHHLTVDRGIVGPQIWYAAWHAPTS